jgi:hypothetical protein
MEEQPSTPQPSTPTRQMMPLAGVDGGEIILSGKCAGGIEGGACRKWFLWAPWDLDVCLDGSFSSNELRAIADYMDHNREESTRKD